MTRYAYRIVNVFAESTFGGNPLCVFEDGRGLSAATMQALARQFNLSETTFLLPSDDADARVRVFTTGYEMRFAGHPTLGSAHVLRDLAGKGDALTLEFLAGVVPVTAHGDHWTLRAPTQGAPMLKPVDLPPEDVAHLVGLRADDLAEAPVWVDTGTDQLLIPLKSADAVRRAQPDSARMGDWPVSSLGRKTGYVFAYSGANEVVARYFFTMSGGGVAEDPGTGSACANLGGWLVGTGKALPAALQVSQGEAVGRPCRLSLEVDAAGSIFVGGRVIELGRGYVDL